MHDSGFQSSFSTCISMISKATSTSLCGDDTCASVGNLTFTTDSTIYTYPTCSFTPQPFSWDPSREAVTVQQTANLVYMIHQPNDIQINTIPDKGLSITDKIIIGVVIPVVVFCAVFVGVYCFTKKSKARKQARAHAQQLVELVDLQDVEREKLLEAATASRRQWRWI